MSLAHRQTARHSPPTTNPRHWSTVHVRTRLAQRYGLDLRAKTITRIARQVESSSRQCLVLEHTPWGRHGRLVVAVRVAYRWVAFVWDVGARALVTALPPSVLEPWRGVLDEVAQEIETGDQAS